MNKKKEEKENPENHINGLIYKSILNDEKMIIIKINLEYYLKKGFYINQLTQKIKEENEYIHKIEPLSKGFNTFLQIDDIIVLNKESKLKEIIEEYKKKKDDHKKDEIKPEKKEIIEINKEKNLNKIIKLKENDENKLKSKTDIKKENYLIIDKIKKGDKK